jgi:hypothetical protein
MTMLNLFQLYENLIAGGGATPGFRHPKNAGDKDSLQPVF